MNKDLAETQPNIAVIASIASISNPNLNQSQTIVSKPTNQDSLPISSMTYDSKRIVTISFDSIEQIYKEAGHKEGKTHHKEHKTGFSYQTLLGEVMHAYITFRPDIGYAVTMFYKFSFSPSEYHYKLLKMVAKYLQTIAHWGVWFKCIKLMKLTVKDYQNRFFPTIFYNIPDYLTLKIFLMLKSILTNLLGFVM